MTARRLLPFLVVLCLLSAAVPLVAQGQTVLSLQTTNASMQTGQTYEVVIHLEAASSIWSMDVEIAYDPDLVYVIGTKAGSPVTQGPFFAPLETSIVARNLIESNRVVYTLSMLAPAQPVSGEGIVGTFKIYPLAAGTTRLTFSQAKINSVTFAADGSPQSQSVSFSPTLLELNISGDTVEPPDEATATPEPTETSTPFTPVGPERTVQPTLVNVTAAPSTPVPLATLPTPVASDDTGSSLPLILAIVVMLIGGIGAMFVLLRLRRAKRK